MADLQGRRRKPGSDGPGAQHELGVCHCPTTMMGICGTVQRSDNDASVLSQFFRGDRRRFMNIQSALKSQYHAALKALCQAVEKCPDALWDDDPDGAAPFWRVVYHTLFYTHFYLQQDQHSFVPW